MRRGQVLTFIKISFANFAVVFFTLEAIRIFIQLPSSLYIGLFYLCISVGLFFRSNFARRIATVVVVFYLYLFTQLLFFSLSDDLHDSILFNYSRNMKYVFLVLMELVGFITLYSLRKKYIKENVDE